MVVSAAKKKEGTSWYFQCISFTCFATVGIKYCYQHNRHRQRRRSVDPSDAVLPMDALEGPTTSVVANETDMAGPDGRVGYR